MAPTDRKPATLCVQPGSQGRFEVREGGRVLGTSQNEMLAVWSAVTVAEQMAKSRGGVRVVRLIEGGHEIEEFSTQRPIEGGPEAA